MLDINCANELAMLNLQLNSCNGQFIRSSLSALKIFELTEVDGIVEKIKHSSVNVPNLMVSDALATSAFI